MKKIFLPLFSAVLFLASCTKDDSGFDGPSLNDIYGDFSILDSLSASAATVDFSAGQQLTFSAEFSKNVNWKILLVLVQKERLKWQILSVYLLNLPWLS